jgi:hypothetical protein
MSSDVDYIINHQKLQMYYTGIEKGTPSVRRDALKFYSAKQFII